MPDRDRAIGADTATPACERHPMFTRRACPGKNLVRQRAASAQPGKWNQPMNDGMAASSALSRPAARTGTIAMLPSAALRRPIVIVLGMHRSGTSLCSNVLSAFGVDMVDRVEGPGHDRPTAENAKGHWERWEITVFHDRILGLFKRGYYEQTHDFPLPVAWWAQPQVAEVRREIAAFLEQRMDKSPFGFKDPRTLRLLPVWQQLFEELRLAPKIVLCLRNPAEVARSLQVRDGLDPDIGELRWFVYTTDFFRYIKDADICVLEYETWFDDPSVNVSKLQKFLDLPWHQSEFELEPTIRGIVDSDLRHDDPTGREARQPLVRSLYRLTQRADHDAAARDQIRHMAAQFLGFQQLQTGFQRSVEHALAAASRLPSTEQETADLRALLDANRAELEATKTRQEAGEAREAELEQKLAEQAEQLAREQDAALASAQAARQALADLEAEITLFRQGAVLSDPVRTEIDRLREDLAGAEQRLAQDAQDAARMQSEIMRMRYTVGQAMQIAQDGAARAGVLDAEIASLQDALATARQVGRAALDALAITQARPSPSEPPGRWRRPLRRLLRLQAHREIGRGQTAVATKITP